MSAVNRSQATEKSDLSIFVNGISVGIVRSRTKGHGVCFYINIGITILDISHRSTLYLKHMMDNIRTSQETRYFSTTSPTG
jgi:hypothetical protein